ncbi:ATP-binding protein [Thiotrichales bacterium 19S3-7]|nr:ATP-binding protein [Thiotrichales bacterium 19S3-7]MCF6801137.1 ATP-binding protein [Thiotrichales bacterium 19S3-11]
MKLKLAFNNSLLIEIAKTIILISIATVVAALLTNHISLTTQVMILLLTVVWCASRYSFTVSIIANGLSFLSYVFIFTSPQYTFNIDTVSEVVTLVAFVIVSTTVGQLTARLKSSLKQLKARESELSTLYDFSASLSKIHRVDEFYQTVIKLLNYYFNLPFVIITADRHGESLTNVYSNEPPLEGQINDAMLYAWQHKKPSGISTDVYSTIDWYFMPMKASNEYVGIVAAKVAKDKKFLTADQQYLFTTMLTQVAYRVLKHQIEAREKHQEMLKEQQHLQKLLLSSVSHDFKTPLASIMGAISSLQAYGEMFSEDERKELLDVAQNEAQRLKQYINKVLQLVRVEHEQINPELELASLNEIVQEVIRQFKVYYPSQPFEFDYQNELFVKVDDLLFKQVIVNLVENAVKYSPKNKVVTIVLAHKEGQAILRVIDQGPGLPQSELSRVFDLFYRFEKRDYGPTGGQGLGLAICKAVVKAHQGEINAYSKGKNLGCCFEIILPLINIK